MGQLQEEYVYSDLKRQMPQKPKPVIWLEEIFTPFIISELE